MCFSIGKYVRILLAATFVMAIGCSKRGENAQNVPSELKFKVNASLLEARFTADDLGVSFSPPKGCAPLEQDLLRQALQRLPKEYAIGDSLFIAPRAIFIKQDERLICLFSALPKLLDGESTIKDYQRAIADRMADSDVRQDYVIPFAFYKQNLEAIESSIGSIAKL